MEESIKTNKSGTNHLNKHVACGAAYKISCTDPAFYRDPVVITHHHGKDVVEKFLDYILHDARELRKMLAYKQPMLPLTKRQKAEYNSPTVFCHICKKRIHNNEIKCRDHCHLTGKYRGPSHQFCNLNYQINPERIQIPCFLHNLKNYDAHLLISAVKPRHGKVPVVPNTSEKYITFTIGDVVFKDSLAFTQSSLESLVDNLKPEQLVSTRRWLENSVKRDLNEEESEGE